MSKNNVRNRKANEAKSKVKNAENGLSRKRTRSKDLPVAAKKISRKTLKF